MKKKVQPKSVFRTSCNKCGELLVKVYPYAVFPTNVQVNCGKCLNSTLKP